MKTKTKHIRDEQMMKKKVSFTDYITTQTKVMKELFVSYKAESILIIVLLSSLSLRDFLNVKFIEHLTNSVNGLLNGDATLSASLVKTTAFVAVILMTYFINWIYARMDERYKEKIRFDIDKKFKDKMSGISYEHYENNSFHEKINRAKNAGENYTKAIYSISQFIRIAVTMSIYCVILARINWIFPAILILSNILTFFIAGKVTDKQLDHWRIFVSPSERRMWYFQNVEGDRINQQTIQTGRMFPYFRGMYEKWGFAAMITYLKLNCFSIVSEITSVIVMGLVYGGTVYIIGTQVISGTVEIGYFTMVVAALMNLFAVMKDYTFYIFQQNWFIRIIQDYNEVMALPVQHEASAGSFMGFSKINVNDISYQYPQSDKYALKNTSCEFHAGERIAIVGHNGSGKTTLTGLLLGLFRSYQGDLFINGEKITDQNIDSLSSGIACLFQDFVQYQMTIKENIELGSGGNAITDEQAIEILRKVGLYDFVKTLDKGIHTPLGQLENGVELSKGQWQKLAVARLLANEEAKIWILDEPTAYLDPMAEIEMYKFIYSLVTNQLVFFISHRLGFARQADRIIVMREGAVAEEGSHIELMEKRSIYHEMYQAQKAWYS